LKRVWKWNKHIWQVIVSFLRTDGKFLFGSPLTFLRRKISHNCIIFSPISLHISRLPVECNKVQQTDLCRFQSECQTPLELSVTLFCVRDLIHNAMNYVMLKIKFNAHTFHNLLCMLCDVMMKISNCAHTRNHFMLALFSLFFSQMDGQCTIM
jgi:hypothetical protein